ncbi:MAG: YdcH family protein [Marinicaulis sp.]|nr:YdcH family protein [Marinicaulis sp.]
MTINTRSHREKLLDDLTAQIRKHRRLDQQAAVEQRRPAPDMSALKRLKQKRLAVKTRIEHVKAKFLEPRSSKK